jgi:ATP-dependent Clp protease ATP-binding subunit ClpA
MRERSKKDFHVVVLDARTEARLRAEAKIEAEHLLLALARRPSWDAGRVLVEAGLDHDRLRDVLDADVEHTLEAVGVSAATIRIPDSTLPMAGEPRWGASAKTALRRASTIARDQGHRSLDPTHILLGVLRASEGTVPRALATAGVDADALAARAEATLDEKR